MQTSVQQIVYVGIGRSSAGEGSLFTSVGAAMAERQRPAKRRNVRDGRMTALMFLAFGG